MEEGLLIWSRDPKPGQLWWFNECLHLVLRCDTLGWWLMLDVTLGGTWRTASIGHYDRPDYWKRFA